MKKFYLRENKNGNLKWCVKKKGKFRKINIDERDELKRRMDSINNISIFKVPGMR